LPAVAALDLTGELRAAVGALRAALAGHVAAGRAAQPCLAAARATIRRRLARLPVGAAGLHAVLVAAGQPRAAGGVDLALTPLRRALALAEDARERAAIAVHRARGPRAPAIGARPPLRAGQPGHHHHQSHHQAERSHGAILSVLAPREEAPSRFISVR